MSRGSEMLRTIVIVLGSSWFGLLAIMARVLVLPAKLGDEGLGQVTLALSFTGIIGILTSLGTSVYLVRAIAQEKDKTNSYLSNALIVRLVTSVATLALMVPLVHILGYAPETQVVILIVGVSMAIGSISNTFESGLQGLGQMSWRSIALTSSQVATVCVGVALLLLGADAIVYALCLPLGALVEFGIVFSYFVKKHPIRFMPSKRVIRTVLTGGLPFFFLGILHSAFGQIDATVLSFFANEHVVGWFGAASQITSLLIVIPAGISAVALPVMCDLHKRSGGDFDQFVARIMSSSLLILAPMGVGLSISAADVIRLLPYSPIFGNAAPALSLLALAVPVTGMLMVLSDLAVAVGQEWAWLKISILAVCVFPPLYVGLIWWFQTNQGNGATGAALANLAGEVLISVWAWIVLPKRVRQTQFLRSVPQILALTLLMAVVVAALQQMRVPVLIYIGAGAMLYAVGAWLLHLITPDDLALVRQAVIRKRQRSEGLIEPKVVSP